MTAPGSRLPHDFPSRKDGWSKRIDMLIVQLLIDRENLQVRTKNSQRGHPDHCGDG